MMEKYNELKYEGKCTPIADKIYTAMGADIKRHDYNTPTGRSLQLKDIDVTLSKNGKPVMISEKFRAKYYGDVFFEIYNSANTSEKGSSFYCEADKLYYFVPCGYYFNIKIQSVEVIIREMYIQVQKEIEDAKKDLNSNRIWKYTKDFIINGSIVRDIKFTIAKAASYKYGNRTTAIGICLTPDTIKYLCNDPNVILPVNYKGYTTEMNKILLSK